MNKPEQQRDGSSAAKLNIKEELGMKPEIIIKPEKLEDFKGVLILAVNGLNIVNSMGLW